MKKIIIGALLSLTMLNTVSAGIALANSDTNLDILSEYELASDADIIEPDDNEIVAASNRNSTRLECNKLYRIKTTEGYCLAMPTSSFGDDRARVKLERTSSGSINQWWYVLPGSSSNFCIVNFATGKVLEVTDAVDYNDAQIGQCTINPRAACQRWKLEYVNSRYVALRNVATGKVMDIPNSNQYAGQIVNQYDFNGCTAQQFKFVSVSSSEYREYTYYPSL